ncbi:MAG: hypothetical protein ACREQV_27185 [Candidatus Binatia bacterium]
MRVRRDPAENGGVQQAEPRQSLQPTGQSPSWLVWSSAHDLVRFGMAHLGVSVTTSGQRSVLSEATRQAMQTVTSVLRDVAHLYQIHS